MAKTAREQKVEDPRILRAIAHPMRNRILGELSAAGHLRAADVAEVLGIPANQASFHLRQLAKYGLAEPAPELARDGRDRVWKPVHEHGIDLEISAMEKGPGGKAAVAVWQRQAAAAARAAVDRAYSSRKSRDTHVMISDHWIRLTKAEAKELAAELIAVQDRWQERTAADDGGASRRRTYNLMTFLQPAPDPES
ncbi:winged helix-turn-helix domain-containing protein [Nocardioides pocheonensis]|uniref:ArsR family transcriptional regulator n=1 Tax=Nocardioides pocheonensis TaxID=661485 RepID=A0A3N0GRW1_9ACTN|nr:helix-turn-helix domain-containing protein [Nocardioides pocheonensis]RNM14908.1 ArsR family transcriptional regulator [Nocardioides pocheonensis]